MQSVIDSVRKQRTLWITFAVIILLFFFAIRGMDTKDWVITLLRGLSVGAVTFLVASGFSLIFGLLDVLNLAHGTLFMIGAYIGWTVMVRPDTFVDMLTPVAIIGAGLAVLPGLQSILRRASFPTHVSRILPWIAVVVAGGVLYFSLTGYPITSWDASVYELSPTTYAFQASQGQLVIPEPVGFSRFSAWVVLPGIYIGALLLAFSIAGFSVSSSAQENPTQRAYSRSIILSAFLLANGVFIFLLNQPITEFIIGLDTTLLFLLAVIVASLSGAFLGSMIEITIIRPLYTRPIYQLMLTLGLSAIGIELVRSLWGRPEFTMPKPSIFNGTGEGCPAASLGDWLIHRCSTVFILEGRVRTYNEIFIPIVGFVVLISVWILLQRTRLGMIIRAGVQDSEMVEALGINVRRVFTLVFALGVGLAALGGVLAGPSTGLSTGMGDSLFLNALIALAIGGLTSYPGAAMGSFLVGLLQQFIIKYGQIGINIPFIAEPFKPTPPLVPASTVLLMVIILLIMPQGLFGRTE